MGKLLAIVASFSLAVSAKAQEFTYRFDWHGFSNLFHASFTVSQQDLSSTFSGPLFWGTITCTNPLGQVFTTNVDYAFATGSYIPWNLTVQLVDFGRDQEVFLDGGAMLDVPYRTAGDIHAYSISGTGPSWLEEGYWQITQQVPEPSTGALFVLGTGLLIVPRRRQRKATAAPTIIRAAMDGSGICCTTLQ